MVRGIGIDTIENDRVADALARHGERFARRILSDPELLHWESRGRSYLFLASRWAAKEAVSKALGCGIGAKLGWHDIVIRNEPTGQPAVEMTGRLLAALNQSGASRVLISITHTRHSSSAAAVLT